MDHTLAVLAGYHQQDLLNEAARNRLAATARSADGRRAQGTGGASPLRRELGWALIGLGAWLAGGSSATGAASR